MARHLLRDFSPTFLRKELIMRSHRIGRAKRVRVELPLGARRLAWDCRPFGLGRVIAPKLPIDIEVAPGLHLDLNSGDLRGARSTKRLAA